MNYTLSMFQEDTLSSQIKYLSFIHYKYNMKQQRI